MSIKICIGLVDVALWPKILDNRLGILTSVLIAMDNFFKWQGNFVYYVTGSSYSRIIFQTMYILRIYTKPWKELKKFSLY